MQSYLPGTSPNSKAQRERRRQCTRRPQKTTVQIPNMERADIQALKRLAKAEGVPFSTYLRNIVLAHMARIKNPLR